MDLPIYLIQEIFNLLLVKEKKIEILRQLLGDSRDFIIEDLFFFLDRHKKNKISGDDILFFCKSFSIYSDYENIKLLISFHDTDHDGYINMEEFRNMMLSHTMKNGLKNFKNQNNLNMVPKINNVVIRIFLEELLLASNLINYQRTLCNKSNYNFWNLYSIISNMGKENIDNNSRSFNKMQ
jgi:hypothetical protein